jgi:hypothetical protein
MVVALGVGLAVVGHWLLQPQPLRVVAAAAAVAEQNCGFLQALLVLQRQLLLALEVQGELHEPLTILAARMELTVVIQLLVLGVVLDVVIKVLAVAPLQGLGELAAVDLESLQRVVLV